jgi:hypothetical protein
MPRDDVVLRDDLLRALDPAALMRSCRLSPDPWQVALLRSPAKRSLVMCSRQAGKSTTTSFVALHEALYRPNALVLLLSPSLRQSGELFRKVKSSYEALERIVGARQESALRLELENGSRIISLPGNEETIRGYSGTTLLILDEAARIPDDLYYSVRPMLAVSSGRLIALTTPFGKRGWFYDEWQNGGPGWQRIKVTAHDCPRISRTFLEEERRTLGDWWFRQEYECEFVETTDQLFNYSQVMGTLSQHVQPLFGE